MENKKFIGGLLIIGVIFLAISPSYGQIIYGQPAAGSLQTIYSHWSLKNDSTTTKINQFTIPVNGFIPLGDNFETQVYVAGSSNDFSRPGNDYSLSGLSDFRIQASHSFSNDRFLMSLGLNLPTGKKELDQTKERAIIDLLSENYLAFPLRRFGEGFGFNLLLGGATMLGAMRCGGGVMYQYNGSYTPYTNDENYKPGDFFSVNANANMKFGKTTLTTDVIYTNYASDKQDEDKIFRQSPQLDLRLGANYDEPSYGIAGNARYLIRGRHTSYDVVTGAILSQLKIYGNEFSINGMFLYHPGEKWSLGPILEFRLTADNEEGLGNSSLFGAGAAYTRRLGSSLVFDLGFRYYSGSADGGNIDLSGLQFTSGLRASF